MRIRSAALAGAMLLALGGHGAHAQAAGDSTSSRGAGCSRLDEQLGKLDQLDSKSRSLVYFGKAFCDRAGSRAWLDKAVAEKDAPGEVWSVKFLDAAGRLQVDAALDALDATVARASDGTVDLNGGDLTIYRLVGALRNDDAAFMRLMGGLQKLDWRPDLDAGADRLWLRYAVLHLQANDLQAARAAVAKIVGPRVLAEITLNKQFDAIVATTPNQFDLEAAAEEAVRRRQAAVRANPADGDALNKYVESLRVVGRADEALKVVDAALAAPTPLGGRQSSDVRNWLLDSRADVLVALGRIDDAISTEQAAAQAPEVIALNVSQTINLSGLQLLAGRFTDALATVDRLKGDVGASPYGQLWIRTTRVCALQQLGRPTEAAQQMAEVETNKAANPRAHLQALLCLNDLDGAAQAVIDRLHPPGGWPTVLYELSDTRERPRSPFEQLLTDRSEAVKRRPDVQAAVAQVGRFGNFPFATAPQ